MGFVAGTSEVLSVQLINACGTWHAISWTPRSRSEPRSSSRLLMLDLSRRRVASGRRCYTPCAQTISRQTNPEQALYHRRVEREPNRMLKRIDPFHYEVGTPGFGGEGEGFLEPGHSWLWLCRWWWRGVAVGWWATGARWEELLWAWEGLSA